MDKKIMVKKQNKVDILRIANRRFFSIAVDHRIYDYK